MNFKFKSIITAVLIMGSSSSFATKGGHGGDIIYRDGQPILLDFAENNLENIAIPEDCSQESFSFLKELKIINDQLKQSFNLKALACKLEQIKKVDKEVAAALVGAIGVHDWQIINFPLSDIEDEFTIIDREKSPLFQLASREKGQIRIYSKIWDEMNTANQVGLILHEAIYSLMEPTEELVFEKEKPIDMTRNFGYPVTWSKTYLLYVLKQNSKTARDINAYLFTENLVQYGKSNLRAKISNFWGTEFSNTGKFYRFLELKNSQGKVLAHKTARRGDFASWTICEAYLPKYEGKKITATLIELPWSITGAKLEIYKNKKLKIINTQRDEVLREEPNGIDLGRTIINTEADRKRIKSLYSVDFIFPTEKNISNCYEHFEPFDDLIKKSSL